MLHNILEWATLQIIQVIDTAGYGGILFLMALEGSFVPVPSEIILPFSGYLVYLGRLNLYLVALFGAIGNIIGTMFSYTVARYAGLPFFYKYGKYFFVTKKDIKDANKLFKKHGTKLVFISRLIPGVRGFIPIPAGIAKMKFWPFITYVFIGSFIYSLFLTYIGVVAGENWDFIEPYFRRFEWVLVVLIVIAIIWWVRRYYRGIKEDTNI